MGDAETSRESCAYCGRRIEGEAIHFRGQAVCGAECFGLMSRRSPETREPYMLRTWPKLGIKVDRSGRWLHGGGGGGGSDGD